MAGSLNRVELLGNLGQDPEVRRTQAGDPVVTLSVATSESWRDKASGEKREATEWHRVVIFNEGIAKVAEQYLKKGSKVFITGQIRTRKWTDQSGADRYSTEIVLANFRGELILLGDGRAAPSPDDYGTSRPATTGNSTLAAKSGAAASSAATPAHISDMDDEIPF